MPLGFAEVNLFTEVIAKNFPKDKKLFGKEEILFIMSEMTSAEKYNNNPVRKKASPHKVFKYFIRYCLYRNLANFDTLILLTGDKGVGKSSFAIMMAREWCRLIGVKFDPGKFIAYTNQQVQDKVQELARFMPLICDESVLFCSSENWNKRENKDLKLRLAQVRTKHLFYILCFPLKVAKVDKSYLDSFVNYWIDLFSRGKGALYVRSLNPSQESWRIKDFQDLGSYNEFSTPDVIAKKLSKHPNFWYLITAPKPSPQLYKKYLAVREKNVYNQSGALANVSKQDICRALLIKIFQDVMMRDSSVTFKRILISIKTEYDFDMKESDLKLAIDDANNLITKIKEEGMKKYDDESSGTSGDSESPETATSDL